MYNLTNINISTLEELHAHIGELDIYIHYFGDINKNEVWFNSPFRQDSKPSFRISFYEGHWVWTDFGISPYPNKVINFVMKIENLNFYEAINFCYYNICKTNKILHVYEKSKKVSCFISKNFKKIELDYFKQASITEQDLLDFNVYTGDIYLNDRIYMSSSNQNPVFIYMFNIEKQKYQGYQPLKTNNRFFNNNINEETLGFNTLKYRKNLLIITKSYKDIIVWNKLGIDAIAPPTEVLFIKEEHLNYFKLIYKTIIVNFDNDETGVKKSIEYTQKYNLGYFNIPKGLAKDPFEFVVKYGYNELLNLLKQKI